ncbi:MAG: TonB-dependent receptor [Bacteroidota bacterium]|nr:TonB-dependent receptor [Bacteroidota bacterium]
MNKILPFHIIIFILLLSFSFVYSQTVIKGKVIDIVTKEPVELAVIQELRTSAITLTDREGKFEIKNTSLSDSITISCIGYASQTFKPGLSNSFLNIQLEKGELQLKEVVVNRHSNNLTSSRILSSIDLNMQPVRSAQDLLRLVPGLFIAQQVGGGKSEQIFLRGFDADHGTDVNVSVDGLQVNLPSQAHGQGWADLHFLIPETVGGYDFGKGPYYANKGDFTTAGYVGYNTLNVLDKSVVKLEAGEFQSSRMVAMINLLSHKQRENGQSAYIAAEGLYTNGPFDYPQHFTRFNVFGKFNTRIGADSKLSATISTFHSKWRASGEIPGRAVSEGYVKDRFGAIDSSQGGYTTRTAINLRLTTGLRNQFTLENQLYYSHIFFNLFTNFTFYYADPVNGDEFNQHEVRDVYGYNGKLSHQNYFSNGMLTSVAGLGFRYDITNPSWLAHSLHGDSTVNFLQLGNIREANANAFLDETIEKGKWLFNLGIRIDYFNFYYLSTASVTDSDAAIYNGVNTSRGKTILCPKINIQYSINDQTQVYVKTGKGFHSNDARAVIANQGYRILPAAYGADLGFIWKPVPELFINAAIWFLYLQQEFTYGSDFGSESVKPGGKTVRKGIDFSARYQVSSWLYANLNLNYAIPRAVDVPKEEHYLPTAPGFTSTGGLYYRLKSGFNGGISFRYLHDRPANRDYSLVALGYFLTDFTANYTRKKYELGISIENLFNQKWYESQVEYVTRLKNESAPVDEVSYTAGVPFFAKIKFSLFF